MGKKVEIDSRVPELLRAWYGSLDDLVVDMKDIGLSPEDVTAEYVTAWDEKSEDDVFYTIKLSVVGSTIVVEDVTWEVI